MQTASLFTPAVLPERMHPAFRRIRADRAHLPARPVLQRAYEILPAPDGNFIKDFQSTGFDARVWELYLASLFDDLGLTLHQPEERPDFLLSRANESVWVEATTANPTQGKKQPEPDTGWEMDDFIAAKLGSPLYSKLQARYWDLPHVSGRPLVLAIADFHNADVYRPTYHPLIRYLYGLHLKLTSLPGKWVTYERLPLATIGPKNTPAGFFLLPDARNISAILFSNAGTVAKFSRMGFNRTIHADIRMLRCGLSLNKDPFAILPEPFAYIVGEAPETWGQEAILFHNPNASYPLGDQFFSGICQYWLDGEKFSYVVPPFFPYVSTTQIAVPPTGAIDKVEELLRRAGQDWVLRVMDTERQREKEAVDLHDQWPPKTTANP